MSNRSIFKAALVEAVLHEYKDILNSTGTQYEPSEKFKNRIGMIIENFNKSRTATVTVIKRLILVAIIAALLTGCALAIPAVREYLLDYFLNDHGSWYGVTFDPEEVKDAPHEIEVFFAPTYTPPGYEVMAEDYSVAGGDVFYVNADDLLIAYAQKPIPSDATQDDWIGIDADDNVRTTLTIDGYKVEQIKDEYYTTLIWTDNNYLYTLDYHTELDDEEAIKIIESIAPVPEEKLNQP